MSSMKIDLLCNDGSPIGVAPPDIKMRGVGGAELAMITLMQTFAERGHSVRVFNNPVSPGVYSGVRYINLDEFNPRQSRDILIIYRSPNARATPMLADIRSIWWSMDQYTVGSYTELANKVNYCVTISPYHTHYHIKNWNIDPAKIGHIDLGVRISDYNERSDVQRVHGRMIYCSVPDRGLNILHAAWPLIVRDYPSATLAITSDYRLWGSGSAGNTQYRLDWAGLKGVTFYGKVSRDDLIRLQLEAEIHAYPCTYEELFCISAAECQVSGAIPITTNAGALRTTNEFGFIIPGDPRQPNYVKEFAQRCINLIGVERTFMETRRNFMMVAARNRFDWNKIAEKWEILFDEGALR